MEVRKREVSVCSLVSNADNCMDSGALSFTKNIEMKVWGKMINYIRISGDIPMTIFFR